MDTKTSNPTATTEAQAKQSAVTGVVAAVEKKFGKGALMRLSDDPVEKVEVIPTGSLSLDRAIGIGGYPRGRIVEVYGPESSGKTTLALHAIAEVQKSGGVAAIIDAEHALDPGYARALGVRPRDLLISQPDYGEQALEIADALIQSGGVDLIVVDSVAALTPKAELEGEMGDSLPGLHARLMSQAMRKITAVAHKHNVTVLFINQLRMKIGVMYGNPETTTGGNALKFYASVRLDVRKRQAIKDGDKATGNFTEVKVVKNKMAPPFRTAEFEVLYGKGIDQIGDVLNVAVEQNVVEKAGSWFSFRGERIGNGRDAAREYLTKNTETFAKIVAAVYAHDLAAS